MSQFELSSHQLTELLRTIDRYDHETDLCAENGAWLAGCLLAASQLEAVLLATASTYAEEVFSYLSHPGSRRRPKSLIELNLRELLNIAAELGWLPSHLLEHEGDDGHIARPGYYADMVRRVRNCIHPGRVIRYRQGGWFDEADLARCYRILEDVIDHLGAKLGTGRNAGHIE